LGKGSRLERGFTLAKKILGGGGKAFGEEGKGNLLGDLERRGGESVKGEVSRICVLTEKH